MEFRKEGNTGYFNNVEAAISANGIYISPYINNRIYVYIDNKNLLLDVEYFELLRLLANMKKTEVKLIDKKMEYNKLGIVLSMKYEDSINIETTIDWGVQAIVSTINNSRIAIAHGPDCEYNDCVYTALIYINDNIYFLKIRITENFMEPTLYKISLLNFVNELVFYQLHQKFKLI
ncbi:hypothetical protein DFR86_10145 [Acidianus sulfidivorans JP7]|uniref:Uncharacterized protein n=1 Tax=Acidianus sulfidivorans JP7 TaxID=619593 RepID=A0A2U9IPD1_9CREN|nr:hypothetical protein [Acidianus sulfidivorans]AWR97863.1 hypothetical protein DFR86_10145 [Acidianus sulfidivorans JP7]